jgi:hypothetical protein
VGIGAGAPLSLGDARKGERLPRSARGLAPRGRSFVEGYEQAGGLASLHDRQAAQGRRRRLLLEPPNATSKLDFRWSARRSEPITGRPGSAATAIKRIPTTVALTASSTTGEPAVTTTSSSI